MLTAEERYIKILKYLSKKRRRPPKNVKHVKYECRKAYAIQRQRVRGRFVSNEIAEKMLRGDTNGTQTSPEMPHC